MSGRSTSTFTCLFFYLLLHSRGHTDRENPMYRAELNDQSMDEDELEKAAISQNSIEITYNSIEKVIIKDNSITELKNSKYSVNKDAPYSFTTKTTPVKSEYYGPKKLPNVNIKKYNTIEINEKGHGYESGRTCNQSSDFIEHWRPRPLVSDIHYRNIGNKSLWTNETNVYVSVHKAENRKVADKLSKNIRVLCMLFDSLDEHLNNAVYVKESWGKRCNVLLFMTNHSSPFLPLITLQYNNHDPMKAAFKYAYNYHRNDADWFMMVDYSTFLVLENLRHMLSEYESSDRIMLLFRILSRGGLDSFIWNAEKELFGCAYDDRETNLFTCLENIGIKMKKPGNSVDPEASRYIELDHFLFVNFPKSTWGGIKKERKKSEYAVAFDIELASHMRDKNFLIYHLRPYGISRKHPLPVKEYPVPTLHDINKMFIRRWLRLFSNKAPPLPVIKQLHLMYAREPTALALAKEVRVLCWVLTHPHNHKLQAATVMATWGQRCHVLLFMSTKDDPSLPIVVLPVPEGRNFLWHKTKAALKYIYDNHRYDADWFFKADDDTFVIVENLRYMLSGFSSSEPWYSGCWFNKHSPQGYMSGGAGYVLSRNALDKFVEIALPVSSNEFTSAEDLLLGRSLTTVGVKFLDSRDSLGRARFIPFTPSYILSDGMMLYSNLPWYWDYMKYNTSRGEDCCSEFAITFHYVKPEEMQEFNYLLYKLRLFGVSYEDKYPHNRYPLIRRKYEPNNSFNLLDFLWVMFSAFE